MAEERLLCLATFDYYPLFRSNKMNDTWTIGRLPTNDLVLDYSRISSAHCSLTRTQGIGAVLTDLSINGTWVNSLLVGKGNKHVLRNGDRISLPGLTKEKKTVFVYQGKQDEITETIWRKYEKGKLLGKGSYGVVRKCFERATGVSYAIKSIDPLLEGPGVPPDMNAAIKREIDVMKTLTPNEYVVQFRESFEYKNHIHRQYPDLVLEYVAGGDLKQLLRRSLRLPGNEAKNLLKQICQGVAFIHRQGIVHRDIKPANILLTAENPPKVKIADFGLAKLGILKTKCGTPLYLAPEVLQNHKDYTNKVDSWSIGVMAFLMVTGTLPYEDTDEIRGAKRRMKTTAIFKVNSTRECRDFIAQLLLKDPGSRLSVEQALSHPWFAS